MRGEKKKREREKERKPVPLASPRCVALRYVTLRRVALAHEREKSRVRAVNISLYRPRPRRTRLPRTSIGSAVSIMCTAGEHVRHVRGATAKWSLAAGRLKTIDRLSKRENLSSTILLK